MERKPELEAVLEALKQALKARGLTYGRIASDLEVSEQTIKRFFFGKDFSMDRIVDICRLAGIDFFELMKLADSGKKTKFELTEEQEEFFADYPHYYEFFIEILGQVPLEEIMEKNSLSKRSIYKYLRELDRLGLIALREDDKFRLLVSGGLRWRHWGPLQSKFSRKRMVEYVDYLFGERNKKGICFGTSSNVEISLRSIKELKKDMEDVVEKYSRRGDVDRILAKDELRKVKWVFGFASPWDDRLVKNLPDP